MDLEEELAKLRASCEELVSDSKLITATSDHVRVQISKTRFSTLTIILHFQLTNNSRTITDSPQLIVEITSKTLTESFTQRLTDLCDEQIRKKGEEQGQPPGLIWILRFVSQFLDEHPLCSCAGELSRLKSNILRQHDTIQLKQKMSTIYIVLREGAYSTKVIVSVPKEYPDAAVHVQLTNCNFSTIIQRYMIAQSNEIARRCVEPPLNRKTRPGAPSWEKKPSLEPVVQFLAEICHTMPTQKCPICNRLAFPENPEDVILDEEDDSHVERVYCGHLYHLGCLLSYMKSPPFTGGQKKCPAPSCGKSIYHEKYKLSAKLTEARWACKEARQQELDEVTDFLR